MLALAFLLMITSTPFSGEISALMLALVLASLVLGNFPCASLKNWGLYPSLRSGDPGFKTRSEHSLNLFLVVPGSTSPAAALVK